MSGAAELLRVARAELGTAEVPAGSNRTKYGSWYGIQDAWCGMFVSWCAHQSGNDDVIPRYAYTPAGAQWFQQRGRWDRSPTVGAIAFYDVSGSGRISHTGIVESVSVGGSWYAIEGNTNGQGSRTGGEVRRQYRTTVGTPRGGFGHPAYATQSATIGPSFALPTIRQGSTGEAVRRAQDALSWKLRAQSRPGLQVDGQFGPATRTAVVWFQTTAGLSADGVIGPQTWRALIP